MNDQQIILLFKSKGIRPTAQRVALYRYLLEHPTHPTAELIHEELGLPCSLMTIYNGLEALAKAGLIRIVTIEPGIQRFDGNPQEHGHFRCNTCHKVYDFPFTAEHLQVHLLDGFQIADHDLYCAGICRDCSAVQ